MEDSSASGDGFEKNTRKGNASHTPTPSPMLKTNNQFSPLSEGDAPLSEGDAGKDRVDKKRSESEGSPHAGAGRAHVGTAATSTPAAFEFDVETRESILKSLHDQELVIHSSKGCNCPLGARGKDGFLISDNIGKYCIREPLDPIFREWNDREKAQEALLKKWLHLEEENALEVRMASCALLDSEEPNGCAVIVGSKDELERLLKRTDDARNNMDKKHPMSSGSTQFMMQVVSLQTVLDNTRDLHDVKWLNGLYRGRFNKIWKCDPVGVKKSFHSHMRDFLKIHNALNSLFNIWGRTGRSEDPHILVYWEGCWEEKTGKVTDMRLSFPGGKRKPGETSEAAAKREAGEELWCAPYGEAEKAKLLAVYPDELEAQFSFRPTGRDNTMCWHVFTLSPSFPDEWVERRLAA